jgi:hypothetical protein
MYYDDSAPAGPAVRGMLRVLAVSRRPPKTCSQQAPVSPPLSRLSFLLSVIEMLLLNAMYKGKVYVSRARTGVRLVAFMEILFIYAFTYKIIIEESSSTCLSIKYTLPAFKGRILERHNHL